ncbi:MAG: hypothetical protein WEE89_09160 [Gemmatimonadota bacterium]
MDSPANLRPAQRRWKTLLVAACLIAGCDSEQNEAADVGADAIAAEPADDVRQGIVSPAATGFAFVPCGSSDTLQLDSSEPLVSIMSAVADSGTGAFAIARLATQTRADTVFFATRDQFECHSDWSSFEYRATGSNPGWVAEVKNSALHVRRQNARDTIVQVSQSQGPNLMFSATDSGVVRLELAWRACRPGNGAHHAWSATLTIGGRTFKGCAVPGKRRPG